MGLKIGSGLKTIRGVKTKVVFQYKLPIYPIPTSAPSWYGQPLAATTVGYVVKDTITKELLPPGEILPETENIFNTDLGYVIKDTITKELVPPGEILPTSPEVFFSDDTTIT